MFAFLVWTGLFAFDEPSPEAARDVRPVLVRPVFTRGHTLVYRFEQEKRVTMQGRESTPFITRSTHTFRMTPRAISAAETELAAAFERIEWSVEGSSADFSFDTARPAKSGEPPYFAFVRAALNREFDVEIEGYSWLPKISRVEALYSPAPGSDGQAQIPYAAARAEEILGPSAVTNVFRSLFSWYPTEAVASGKDWRKQEKFALGTSTLVRTNVVWLTGVDDHRMVFRSKIEISSSPNEQAPVGTLPVEFIPGEPGSAAIVYRKNPGVVELIEAQLGFAMKVRPPAQGGKSAGGGESLQRLFARSSMRLVELRPPGNAAN